MAIYTGAGGYLTYAYSPGFGLSFSDIHQVVNATNTLPYPDSTHVSIDDYDGTWDDDGYWGPIQDKSTGPVRLYGGSEAQGGEAGAVYTGLSFSGRPRPRRPVSNGITLGTISGNTRTVYLSITDNGNYGDFRLYSRQGTSSGVSTTFPSAFTTTGWTSTNAFTATRYAYFYIAAVRRNWSSSAGGTFGYSRGTHWWRYVS